MATQHEQSRIALLAALRVAGLELEDSPSTRSMFAHDASNYRITPLAVVFPRSTDEVITAVRLCAEHGVAITPRGAGTGTAGNTIGSGVILEFRRHLSRIHGIDTEARTVVVEAGAILDDLNRTSETLMFGPDPSSHSRATIGGMLGNDACGNHSIAYGRTSAHVIELEVVLADGSHCIVDADGIRTVNDGELKSDLVDTLQNLGNEFSEVISAEFDRSPRHVSGYAAQYLVARNLAKFLVGSEGTLAIVVAAKLQLVERPRHKQLFVVGYENLIAAARDVPMLLKCSPAAIEAVDSELVATMRAQRGSESVATLPAGEAWLFVEFFDTIATAQASELAEVLNRAGNARSFQEVASTADAMSLWQIREDGAGLASNLRSGARGRPGWEDAAVPPEHLADYLEALSTLQTKHGFQGVLYGHFGAGCVHIRYDFELETAAGRERMQAFVQEAAGLIARFGGSISGEHGDGRARTALLQAMYSPAALSLFQAIKRAWDPRNILNPGPITSSTSVLNGLAPAPLPMPSVAALRRDRGDLGIAAARCVGIARCVSTNVSAMCPTYNVTRREEDGTRGRARTLQDLASGIDVTLDDAVEVLDHCLACKACATECPTGVDMAAYKAEILNRRYRGRPRPLTHYTLGWLPRWVAMSGPFAVAANYVLDVPVLRRIRPLLTGISADRSLPRLATQRERAPLASITAEHPRALLFIDTATKGFNPALAQAAQRVLLAAGIPVQAIAQGCCGLTYISSGQFERAQRVQSQLLDALAAHPDDLPIIVLEPSCAVSLMQDLPSLSSDSRATTVSSRILTFADALTSLAPDWEWPSLPPQVIIQTHCHERAARAGEPQTTLLAQRGAEVSEPIGCCGMGGSFGFEAEHFEMSVAVAESSLAPTIDAHNSAVVVADGFGCRCQIAQVRPEREARHLATLLDSLL